MKKKCCFNKGFKVLFMSETSVKCHTATFSVHIVIIWSSKEWPPLLFHKMWKKFIFLSLQARTDLTYPQRKFQIWIMQNFSKGVLLSLKKIWNNTNPYWYCLGQVIVKNRVKNDRIIFESKNQHRFRITQNNKQLLQTGWCYGFLHFLLNIHA